MDSARRKYLFTDYFEKAGIDKESKQVVRDEVWGEGEWEMEEAVSLDGGRESGLPEPDLYECWSWLPRHSGIESGSKVEWSGVAWSKIAGVFRMLENS